MMSTLAQSRGVSFCLSYIFIYANLLSSTFSYERFQPVSETRSFSEFDILFFLQCIAGAFSLNYFTSGLIYNIML